MPLILPNTIDANTTADAVEVEQNNGVLTQYVNTNLISRDGSVAMTNPLLLAGDPTQPNQASNKAYVDARVAAQLDQTEADLLYVNVAGDAMTGVLTAPNVLASDVQNTSVNALTRKDYVDARVATYVTKIIGVGVGAGNCPQGVTTLSGSAVIPATPWSYKWTVMWNYFLAGQTTGSDYRMRVINLADSSLLGVGGYDHYNAGQPHAGFVTSGLLGVSTVSLNVGFQIEIVTAGANTNINGHAIFLGVPD